MHYLCKKEKEWNCRWSKSKSVQHNWTLFQFFAYIMKITITKVWELTWFKMHESLHLVHITWKDLGLNNIFHISYHFFFIQGLNLVNQLLFNKSCLCGTIWLRACSSSFFFQVLKQASHNCKEGEKKFLQVVWTQSKMAPMVIDT